MKDMGDGTFARVVSERVELNMLGTRVYNLALATSTAVSSTSSSAVAIGNLNDAREVLFSADTRCYVALGGSDVAAAAKSSASMLPIEPSEKFHLRLPAGVTHYRVIRDTADGELRVIPIA
jgi:hypothetical protein